MGGDLIPVAEMSAQLWTAVLERVLPRWQRRLVTADQLTQSATGWESEDYSRAVQVMIPAAIPFEVRYHMTSEHVEEQLRKGIEREQRNVRKVFSEAYHALGDDPVPNTEPSPEWMDSFVAGMMNLTSEQMREWFAKLLVGEVKQPGSVSVRALRLLRDLDQETAELFKRLCSMCLSWRRETIAPTLTPPMQRGGLSVPEQLSFDKYGLGARQMRVLREYGLVVPELSLTFDILPLVIDGPEWGTEPFRFQGAWWCFVRCEESSDFEPNAKSLAIEVSAVAMTRAGHQLASFVETELKAEYAHDFRDYFTERGLKMREVDPPG